MALHRHAFSCQKRFVHLGFTLLDLTIDWECFSGPHQHVLGFRKRAGGYQFGIH